MEQCQVDVNQPICDCKADVHGDTALLIMSSIGDKEIVQYLTEHGTDPSKINMVMVRNLKSIIYDVWWTKDKRYR